MQDPRYLMQVMLDMAKGLNDLHLATYICTEINSNNAVVGEDHVVKLTGFELASKSFKPVTKISNDYYLDPRILCGRNAVYNE